ncbi:hypothetical protein J0A68_12580 [Algoriphagus sp. H41]|uniref:Rhamnan synthesis protein F n=1 Tax=Algoriphagus oliviformis TaxID=2811231 RepID=A0ABS3C6K4_9BACT|nr:rhamnan synthesis F family protein [Algoriphagus oliviformis]MBN7811786.1 hypothetical protein [Algoriphagus oliviformis]
MDHCIFIHYGLEARLPFPEMRYLQELSKCFSKTTLVTNERDFKEDGLPPGVELLLVKNEGYDFGKFLKAFRRIDSERLDRLVLANDSNVLLGDLKGFLKKGEALKAEFWGAIDSHEKPWFSTHQDDFHLQSHFLVWEKTALPLLRSYLGEVKVQEVFVAEDLKQVRRNVINVWEIGLSQFFLRSGSAPRAVFATEELARRWGKKKKANLTIKAPGKLLELGYPFLKKKAVLRKSFWKRLLALDRDWKGWIGRSMGDPAEAKSMIAYFTKLLDNKT